MNHREHLAADKAKRDQPEFDEELLKQIEEAVKPDNRNNQPNTAQPKEI